MLSKPVFIVGAHKSGTSLLRSLLDGAPGLFVFPKEPHYFSYVGWPVSYPLRRQAAAEDPREHLRRSLEADNRDTNPYSDLPDFAGWDLGRFWTALGDDDLDYPNYIRALRVALTGSNGRERVVDKSTENIEFVPILAQWFPDASFLHVIRNPYANLVSIRRYKMKRLGRYPVMYEPAAGLRFSVDAIARNQRIAENYSVVRYEDVVQQTEHTMRRVAEHIGIDFVDELLRPTVLGELWGGNSTTDRVFSRVSIDPLERWKADITLFERALAVEALRPYFDGFGYEREPAGRTLLPSKHEGPRTYFVNRALLRLPW
ncbi:MAG: sulfotransferase [Dehalococcoidia bacterium]